MNNGIKRTTRNHGNEERRYWRQQCRNKLSFYLSQELGITVDPNEIRLKPKLDDPYRWRLSPSKAKLFEHQLSKQSLGCCKDIFHSIGKTIKVVPAGIIDGNFEKFHGLEENSVGCQMEDCVRLKTEKKLLETRTQESEDKLQNITKELEEKKFIVKQLQEENGELQHKLGQASAAWRALSKMVLSANNIIYT